MAATGGRRIDEIAQRARENLKKKKKEQKSFTHTRENTF